MSNTDSRINIVVTSEADTSGIDAANKALDDMAAKQQGASGAGTIGMDASPEAAKAVDETTAAYDELSRRIAELEQQLQQQATAHKANRAAAEQSAGGIVGAYNKVKGAVVSVKAAIGVVMWWMAAANQAAELLGKVWDMVTAKSRAAKEEADKQAAAEQAAWERLRELKQAVYDEATARRQAAREMEQNRVNRTYEDRLKLIERSMELEAVIAQIAAAKANDQYAVRQAELQRDLATRKITQAQFDEQSRQAEIDHNEALRKEEEKNATEAIKNAQEQERINREFYEGQMKRLRELKEAAGTVYHEISLLGAKVSVGVNPAKSKIMDKSTYQLAIGKADKANTDRGDAASQVDKAQQALDRQREIRNSPGVRERIASYGEASLDDGDGSLKKLKKAEEALAEQQRTLSNANETYTKYAEIVRAHKDALVKLGLTSWKEMDPKKWIAATEQYNTDVKTLSNPDKAAGSVSAAQQALTEATKKTTEAQTRQTAVIEVNNNARGKEAQETKLQRESRAAKQGRETAKQAREAQVGAAQQTVDRLQRTAEQQQQAAKTQQEVIDRIVKDSTDKNFETFIDRMQSVVDQQSNEGGYHDRLQQALEMLKGYTTASPEQLAGKMDEMKEVIKRATLPYSMTGGEDSATFTRMMEALLAKAALGNQMHGTTQQQQTAGNNLTEVRDATSAVDAADAGVQGMTNAVSAMATMALSLRDKSTSPEAQADLDTIASVMADGIVAANETGRVESALQSLALSDQQAYDAITGRMQEMLGLISAQLPALQAIPPWAGKVGNHIQQLRDSYSNLYGAMSAGCSTLP